MREIKFRGFDKVGKEMFRVKMISFLEDGKFILSGKGGSITSEDCVIMQYTGLKDKNGKEIYESDILEHSQHGYTEKFEVCYGLGNYDSGVYKFIGFYLKKISNGDDDGYTGYMFDTNYIEVIGNIWQNPELLDNQTEK